MEKVERVSGLIGEAVFSADRKYRYWLERDLSRDLFTDNANIKTVTFVMLNPSTADEMQDDPTIRRCIGFARSWGYEQLIIANIFGLRSTDPQGIYDDDNPIDHCGGYTNNRYIRLAARKSKLVVCAWGNHGAVGGRGYFVEKMLREDPSISCDIKCLGVNATGHPKHPLYLRSDSKLQEFSLMNLLNG